MEIQKEKHAFLRMLVSITKENEEKKLGEVYDLMHIPIIYQCRGKGTAPSEIMDILGLGGTTRLITISFLPEYLVHDTFDLIRSRLSFHEKGGGIALTIPVTGLQSPVFQMFKDEVLTEMEKRIEGDLEEMKEKSEYTLIWVSVVVGYSDDVIDAARSAGAKGGTVLKGRRQNSEHVSRHLGLSLHEEQDFVMVVVPREKKAEVMSAISASCGLNTEAHGIVLSLPVDEVMGLE